MNERVVALVDMDCFYVQVEQRAAPEFWGKPCAIVQYSANARSLIAISYEARALGIKKAAIVNVDQAKTICPELHLFKVPEIRGKANLARYREASSEVFDAIVQYNHRICDNRIVVEKASIDEAFLDLSEEVDFRQSRNVANLEMLTLSERIFVELDFEVKGESETESETESEDDSELENGSELENCSRIESRSAKKKLRNDEIEKLSASQKAAGDLASWLAEISRNPDENETDIRLAIGAVIMKEIRDAILEKTEFKCSAGVCKNKMLAKLAAGMHKPNSQTILPDSAIPSYLKVLPICKVRNLGGKLGEEVQKKYNVQFMDELRQVEKDDLFEHFGAKNGQWLHDVSNGADDEPVTDRLLPKSIGCSKNFMGKTALTNVKDVKYWLLQFAEEIVERYTEDKAKNKRTPQSLTVGAWINKESNSKVMRFDSNWNAHQIYEEVFKTLFNDVLRKKPSFAISGMSLSASKFIDDCDHPRNKVRALENYFAKTDLKSIDLVSKNVNENNNGKMKERKKEIRKKGIEKFFNKVESKEANGIFESKNLNGIPQLNLGAQQMNYQLTNEDKNKSKGIDRFFKPMPSGSRELCFANCPAKNKNKKSNTIAELFENSKTITSSIRNGNTINENTTNCKLTNDEPMMTDSDDSDIEIIEVKIGERMTDNNLGLDGSLGNNSSRNSAEVNSKTCNKGSNVGGSGVNNAVDADVCMIDSPPTNRGFFHRKQRQAAFFESDSE